MNRYFERKHDGFIITYKRSKFHRTAAMPIDSIKEMSDSIYDACIFPMSAWDIYNKYVDKFNKEYGENVITMEKLVKTAIIETENMFN